MKKVILGIMSLVLVFGLVSLVKADINAITPSTNDINRTNGWAHVNQLSVDVGSTDLEFVSTRRFWSCFEYRTDGDTSQVRGVNPNPDITDGLYPYYCQSNNNRIKTIEANEYVEVRMVIGRYPDERFDWTRFDVLLYDRTAEIISPSDGEVVSGMVSFDARLDDKDGNDDVEWAVRKGTCALATETVLGNVDGYADDYDWDGAIFQASADISTWENGNYCFVFNPTESVGDIAIEEIREFIVNNPPSNKEQCKNGGWETFINLEFKNQGDCVSWLGSNPNASGNRKDN